MHDTPMLGVRVPLTMLMAVFPWVALGLCFSFGSAQAGVFNPVSLRLVLPSVWSERTMFRVFPFRPPVVPICGDFVSCQRLGLDCGAMVRWFLDEASPMWCVQRRDPSYLARDLVFADFACNHHGKPASLLQLVMEWRTSGTPG